MSRELAHPMANSPAKSSPSPYAPWSIRQTRIFAQQTSVPRTVVRTIRQYRSRAPPTTLISPLRKSLNALPRKARLTVPSPTSALSRPGIQRPRTTTAPDAFSPFATRDGQMDVYTYSCVRFRFGRKPSPASMRMNSNPVGHAVRRVRLNIYNHIGNLCRGAHRTHDRRWRLEAGLDGAAYEYSVNGKETKRTTFNCAITTSEWAGTCCGKSSETATRRHPHHVHLRRQQPLAAVSPFRFSSEYHDDAIGCVYYNYRHYNPLDGRWMSKDPMGEEGNLNLSIIFLVIIRAGSVY